MQSRVVKVASAGAVLLALIQVVPSKIENPPVTADIGAPAPVATILRRACYDCHSNETILPWYAHVAPVSWLLRHDVSEGREELNFSRWGELSSAQREKKVKETLHEIEEGDMPPWQYLPLHSNARLSDQDREVLKGWLLGPMSAPSAP